METVATPSLFAMLRDFADLARPASWRTPPTDMDVPRGDGHTILFVPGAAGNDFIMGSARKYYRLLGYDAQGWGLGDNHGPFRSTIRALERRLFALNDRSGRRVSLAGKSLGGIFARELAKKYPERVRRLFLICAPVRYPMKSILGPVFNALSPFYDPAYHLDRAELSRPALLPTTAFHTKQDGLIAWQCCLEQEGPLAENIELLGAYHSTAAMHPFCLRTMALRLAIPEDRGTKGEEMNETNKPNRDELGRDELISLLKTKGWHSPSDEGSGSDDTLEDLVRRAHANQKAGQAPGLIQKIETSLELDLIELQQLWEHLGLPM